MKLVKIFEDNKAAIGYMYTMRRLTACYCFQAKDKAVIFDSGGYTPDELLQYPFTTEILLSIGFKPIETLKTAPQK